MARAFDDWCDPDYGLWGGYGYGDGYGYGPLPPGYKAPDLKLAKPTDFPLLTNV